MRYRDIWILAFRNLKAGKKNVRKIIFGIGCAFTLVYCFASAAWFYKDYKEHFEESYKSSCYFYQYLQADDPDSLLEPSKAAAEEYNAKERSLLLDIDLKGESEYLFAEELVININDTEYLPHAYYVKQKEYYYNIAGGGSIIQLGFYNDNVNIFPEYLYPDGFGYIGNFPSRSGEIMLDDYLLRIYGINDEADQIIGAEISLSRRIEDESVICENYIVSGIFKTDELAKREEKTYHDYHFEHIYINLRPEDKNRFSFYGSCRFYFPDYDSYLENCSYAEDLLQMELDSADFAKTEYQVTEKGMEICTLNWVMNKIGRLITILGAVIILVILFSLFYIIRFYRMRNLQYMKMLSCIGMNQKDRKSLYNTEMFLMIFGATLAALYFSFIFLMIFNYITNNVLSYGFTLNPCLLVGTVALCFAVMWGYKNVVMINIRYI